MATILSSGDHLLDLIDDVLDLSKIEAGRVEFRPAAFDLGGLLRDLDAMFRQRCRQKELDLRVEWAGGAGAPSSGDNGVPRSAPASGPRVVGDERKLRQVLINLLGNALKFTDAGSVVLRVRQAREVPAYAFEVADTGIGIPASAAATVFEPFRQAPGGSRRGGTGLGLAIARQHVELMGGRLTFAPAAGGGTTFSFSLPLPAAAASRTSARAAGAGAESDPEGGDGTRAIAGLAEGCIVRALVVDDVAENRQVLAGMLSAVGCDVTIAASGEEALRAVRAGVAPDVAFIDLMMPGMSGAETAAAIRAAAAGQTGGRPRLVATSASALAHEREACRRAGFDEFLPKPLRCDRMYELLGRLPGVTFRRASGPPEVDRDAPTDDGAEYPGDRVGLPDALRAKLLAAAEAYRVADVKRWADEVDRLGPDHRATAAWLRARARAYDMERICAALRHHAPCLDGSADESLELATAPFA